MWKKYKISDLVEKICVGFVGPCQKYYCDANNGVPMIRTTNLTERNISYYDVKYITHEFHNKNIKSQLRYGDILVARHGDNGKACMYLSYKEANCLNAVIIRPDKDRINPKFFLYQFNSPLTRGTISSLSSGSVQDVINTKQIAQLEIEIPDRDTQDNITEVLSSLDDKIDLLLCQNKTLEQIAETLFRQWFVEEAEDEWDVGTLGDVISIFDNKRIPVSSMEREKMKIGKLYPYYGAATIMDYINDFIFEGEYILMGEDGTVQTIEGYPILQLPVGKFWVNNHTHIFQAKKPFSNFFIYIFLKKTNISNIITGAVQPKINQQALKSIEFVFPDKHYLDKYLETTNEIWNKIKNNNNQINTLTKLRDTLLPKLMRGEVRVIKI